MNNSLKVITYKKARKWKEGKWKLQKSLFQNTRSRNKRPTVKKIKSFRFCNLILFHHTLSSRFIYFITSFICPFTRTMFPICIHIHTVALPMTSVWRSLHKLKDSDPNLGGKEAFEGWVGKRADIHAMLNTHRHIWSTYLVCPSCMT